MESAKVGARIRKFRENQGVSAAELADRAGLSRSVIDRAEDGSFLPSIGELVRIARALGVRLGTFLDDQVTPDPFISRAAERSSPGGAAEPQSDGLSTGGGKKGAKQGLRYHPLGGGKADRHMEPFHVEIPPGTPESLSSHEGEEFIVVISGRVELACGGAVHLLDEGDSAYYNSILPHRAAAAGNNKAEIYGILYIPF